MAMQDTDMKGNYCKDIVQKHDADRYACSLFAPRIKQKALWALFAFNHEIAKTREVVTETQLGLIRLQWWREAIDEIYAGKDIRAHQILQPLANIIIAFDLEKEDFETLLYAREFDLEDVQPENPEGLVNYADFTNTSLINMTCQVCNISLDEQRNKHLGIAYGLTGLMRGVMAYAKRQRCFLPLDLVNENKIKLSFLYQGKSQEGLPQVIEIICKEAQRNLDIATQDRLPKPLHAQARLIVMNLNMMKKAGYDPFLSIYSRDPNFKLLRMI